MYALFLGADLYLSVITETSTDNANYQPFISQLRVQDTQTILLFMVPTNIHYLNQTVDPWFSATTPDNTYVETLYTPDQPASVIGCVTERTWCNPDLPASIGCLKAFSSTIEQDIRKAWPEEDDRRWLRPLATIIESLGSGRIDAFYQARSVPNLLARQTLLPWIPFVDTPAALQTKVLPSDQWQKEIEYVSQANLAAMQHFVVDYARGVWAGSELCNRDLCQRLCYSQVSIPRRQTPACSLTRSREYAAQNITPSVY